MALCERATRPRRELATNVRTARYLRDEVWRHGSSARNYCSRVRPFGRISTSSQSWSDSIVTQLDSSLGIGNTYHRAIDVSGTNLLLWFRASRIEFQAGGADPLGDPA